MDLQRFEDKLTVQRRSQLWESLVQGMPHLAWLADEQGEMFWWNQQWFEYTGKSEADMRDGGWRSVHHPDHVQRVLEGLNKAFHSGEEWEDTFPMSNGRGGWKWFLSRAVPVREIDGVIQGWIGTHTDITERRQAEEQIRRSRDAAQSAYHSKAELLLNLSREIRTPMNTILGFASLMKDSTLSEPERVQFLEKIISNGDQLLQLMDDILNLSKYEVGEKSIEKVRFNFSDMVFDVVQAMTPIADKKGVKLLVSFHTAIPGLIQSDPHRTRQILTTLVGNAIKYTEGGGRILISMEFQKNFKYGPSILVDVEDTGIGISEEQQRKIFQPFAQLDMAGERTVHGSRLGLALSERLAESLGGELSLKGSEMGQGSCFSLLLPTGEIHDVEFIKAKKAAPFAKKFLSGLRRTRRLENVRVLLAEDSEDNETLVRLYLEKEGAQITYAHNGLEVLDLVKGENFDIILMDIQMPLLDGLEATRQLRQRGFQKPIVALTAHALKDDIEKSLKAGCDTHLTKPIRGEALIEEIQKRVFH